MAIQYPGDDIMLKAIDKQGLAIDSRRTVNALLPDTIWPRPLGMEEDEHDLAVAYMKHGQAFMNESLRCIQQAQEKESEYGAAVRKYRDALAWETMIYQLYDRQCERTSPYYWERAVELAGECLRAADDSIANSERAREPWLRARRLFEQYLEVDDDDGVPSDCDGGATATAAV